MQLKTIMKLQTFKVAAWGRVRGNPINDQINVALVLDLNFHKTTLKCDQHRDPVHNDATSQ